MISQKASIEGRPFAFLCVLLGVLAEVLWLARVIALDPARSRPVTSRPVRAHPRPQPDPRARARQAHGTTA